MFAFVIAIVFAKTLSLSTCPASVDEMDLCQDGPYVCMDEMDLCDDAGTSTTTNTATVTAAVITNGAKATRKGSMSVTVDANKNQVKNAVETGLGNLLHGQGVGATPAQAKSFVNATVTASRRLQWSRELAAQSYSVAWIMSFPSAHESTVDAFISNVTTTPAHIQNAMKDAFAAAGVTSATTVTVASFAVDVQLESQNSNRAFPIAGTLTTAMVLLMSTFALLL
jgi:hypothetical protein